MPDIIKKTAALAAIRKAVAQHKVNVQDKVFVWALCKRLIHIMDVLSTGATPNANRMSLAISTSCTKPAGITHSRRRVKKGCNVRYIEDVINVLVNDYTPSFLSDWDDVVRAIADCTAVNTETTVISDADEPTAETETFDKNEVHSGSYNSSEEDQPQTKPVFSNFQVEMLDKFEDDLAHQLRMIQLAYERANIVCKYADDETRHALSVRFMRLRDDFVRKCLERIN
jgi:hypothetical protein